jgi:hypothetical protein
VNRQWVRPDRRALSKQAIPIHARATTQMPVREGVLASKPAMIRAVGIHHAIRLVRVLPSQSLELWSDIGVQQGSTPSWIGGHGTEP